MAFSMLGVVPATADSAVSADLNTAEIKDDEVKLEGNNALGNMLVDKINSSEENDDMGFTIQNVAVDGKDVTVEYSFVQNCTMIVGIYDDEGTVMLGKGMAEILTGSSSETVEIDIDTMPEYFLVKVFMVDTTTYRPLGEAYTYEMYTKRYQDFLALTTDDFDSDRVLNLDDDKKNNFIVFEDDVIRFDEADGEIVSGEDNSTVTYTISNASDRVKALKEGDIFTAGDIENIVIAKVGSVTVDGDNVVITEGDINEDEVLKVIKIDIDSSDATVTIDDSYADEGITFLGDDVELPEIPDEYNGTGKLYDFDDIPEMETQELNVLYKDYNAGTDFTFKFLKSEPDSIDKNDGWNVHSRFDGYFKINVGLDLKIYKYGSGFFDDIDFVRISLPLSLELALTMDFEGYYQHTISRVTLATLFGITAEMDPKLYFKGKATVTAKGYIDFTPTFEYHVYTFEGTNQTRLPETGFELSTKLDASIGIILSPKFTLFSDNIAYILTDIGGGLHFVINEADNTSINAKHQCGSCVSGKLYYEAFANIEMDIVGLEKITDIVFEMDHYLWQFYWSKTYGDHGKGTCKHYQHKCKVHFLDEDGGKLSNATVYLKDLSTGEKVISGQKLNKNGTTDLWLVKGNYEITVEMNNAYFKPYNFEFQDYYSSIVVMRYDRSIMPIKPVKPPKEDDPPKDDQPTDPKEDDNPPEYLSVVRSKKTLSYKKGNGMKLVEGGNPAGCMGFIDANGTFFVWGLVCPYLDKGYGYYSIPNVKKAEIEYFGVAILNKDDNLYYYGQKGVNGNRVYYEKPTLIAENVKDFCIKDSLSGYAYVTKNGELYVHDEEGTTLKSLRNVRAVYNDANDSAMACITENGELYMWGDLGWYIPDYNSNNMIKIADNVKDFEFGLLCAYYITNNGDLHSIGLYTEDMPNGENVDYSDQVRMTGIKDVSSTSSYGDRTLILAENGDLYKLGQNDDMYPYSYYSVLKELYPNYKEIKSISGTITIYLKNGETITIPAEERPDYYYRRVKIASNVKSITSLWGNSMYIDKNNDIYIWGHYGSDDDTCGIYERKGQLWETNPTTPVKLDDVYASLPAFETETQSVNADTADDVNDAEDTFADLLPDCIYNVYGFNQEYMELSDDGLGYVNQFVTDSNGSLPFDKASVEGSESLYWKAVPMTRLSIADAQVEIAELKYNGEEQDIDPIVTLNGKTLVRNADYFVAEGESFTSAGEYTGLICGMGIYKGELEFTYTVTGGKLGDVNGDNKINITDVTLVAAHIKGKRMLAADKIIYADINKDGKINITDVTKIAAHIKGKKLIS